MPETRSTVLVSTSGSVLYIMKSEAWLCRSVINDLKTQIMSSLTKKFLKKKF